MWWVPAPRNSCRFPAATHDYGPVSLTSGSSSVTPTPGDNDTSIATTAFVTSALSAFTGGGGVVSEAPVDGTAYGRLSATWNKVPWFTAKGNVFLGTAEPANISRPCRNMAAASCRLGILWRTGIANDAYYDGNAFRRTSATAMPIWLSVSGGALAFQTAPVGALDSVASLSTMFYVDGGGSTTATGSVWAINRTGAFGLTDFGSGYFGLRFTSDWWRLAFNSNTGDLIYIHPDGRWLHNSHCRWRDQHGWPAPGQWRRLRRPAAAICSGRAAVASMATGMRAGCFTALARASRREAHTPTRP